MGRLFSFRLSFLPIFASESEPRLTRREVGERPTPKYRFVHGMGYIKIK
jgi:hypothetical protein